MNSFVQSASAPSPRPTCPGAEAAAASAPGRNSEAQSPDSASAATPGASDRDRTAHEEGLLKYHCVYAECDSMPCTAGQSPKHPLLLWVCAHLAVELVCSSAGQSAASPPGAAPCQNYEEAVRGPAGTHWPTKHGEGRLLGSMDSLYDHGSYYPMPIRTDTDLFLTCYLNRCRRNLGV